MKLTEALLHVEALMQGMKESFADFAIGGWYEYNGRFTMNLRDATVLEVWVSGYEDNWDVTGHISNNIWKHGTGWAVCGDGGVSGVIANIMGFWEIEEQELKSKKQPG